VKLPAYPRYKSSLPAGAPAKAGGVEWLGDVPEHWDVKRGRFAMRVNPPAPQLRALKPEDEVSFVPMEAVGVQGGLSLEQTRVLADVSSGYTEFQDGDVVVAKITPCFENGKAALARGLVNGAAYGTTELHVLRAGPTLDRSFLFYVAISDTFRKLGESEMYGAGGQKRVPPEFNKDFRTPLPPSTEQRAIAAFLDRETGRVDRLVAKKRELIERLKEKRTALISRTVTRGLPAEAAAKAGLPANPPLKPSGIEWIGDIPKHWEVRKFSRCAFFQEGPGLRNWQFTQDGIRVICVTNITEAGISFSNYEKFISEDEYQRTYRHFTVAKGDLLLSSSGNSWGKVATFDADDVAILNTSTIRVNENSSRTVIRPLIGWLLISEGTREQLGLFMTGSCQPNFGPSHLARVWICVPPLPEQAAIAAYLDEETAKLDALVGKVEEAVERLQEYRTALITAAVTGKIDVRTVKR
jgi:type I restriction enzyme S subunit